MIEVLNFVSNYWLSFIIIFAVLGILIYLWNIGNKKRVLLIVNSLVVEAEKYLGSKTGSYKKDKVIETFYSRLPIIITMFVSIEELENYIDDAAARLKLFLQEEENNLSGLPGLDEIRVFTPEPLKTE